MAAEPRELAKMSREAMKIAPRRPKYEFTAAARGQPLFV